MSGTNPKYCRYCTNLYLERDSEHVFPKGLGGQTIFIDNVCIKCNNEFSTLERELYQKSIIGLMRSVEGIGADDDIPFKAPLLLNADAQNHVVYEVGQYGPMKTFVRPQILFIDGQFYMEAESNEKAQALVRKFNLWKRNNRCVETGLSNGEATHLIEFRDDGNAVSYETNTDVRKIKEEIRVDVLIDTNEHYQNLHPRLYMDDDNVLRIRTRSVKEGIDFMVSLLATTRKQVYMEKYSTKYPTSEIISVGFGFDNFKGEQALVKIGLNCLMHYFPSAKNDPALDDYISFVKSGAPLVGRYVPDESTILDLQEKTHNLFFYQYVGYLDVRIGLFNGHYRFGFSIPGLLIL